MRKNICGKSEKFIVQYSKLEADFQAEEKSQDLFEKNLNFF
jgi:hypothetical protein